MTSSRRAETLRQASRDLVDRIKALEAAPAPGADEALRVGDLLIDDAAAESGLQWAVVGMTGSRVRLVPADAMAWLGPGDLAVQELLSDSILVLRSRHGVSVGLDWLARAERCGRFDARVLEQLEEQTDLGSAGSESSADEDLELDYREWIDQTVVPLVRSMSRPLSRTPAELPARFAKGRGRPGLRWLAVAAASLFLGFCLGWWGHPRDQPASDAEVTSAAEPAGAIRQLAFAFLRPTTKIRGRSVEWVELGSGDRSFALAIGLDPLALADGYRVRIDDADGRSLIEDLEVARGDQLFLSLELEAAEFPPATYWLHLQALGGAEEEATAYGFEVRRPFSPSQSP